MNISENIKDDWSYLKYSWQDCHSKWHDNLAREFERVYWQEYESTLPSTISKLEELEYLVKRVLKEVD